MAKASQLEKVLCRRTRQRFCGHQELADSFKRLHSLIERLSQHLSRQELEGILVNMNAQRSVEPSLSAVPVAVAQPPSTVCVEGSVAQPPPAVCVEGSVAQPPSAVCVEGSVAQPPPAVTQRPTDDN